MKTNSIEELTPLVKSIAKKYAGGGAHFDDLVQEGLVGVLEAGEKYDGKKGAKFSTYAVYWIKKKILEYIQKEKALKITDIEELEKEIPCNDAATIEKQPVCGQLPETEKMVLDLFINSQKTLSEIAVITGLRREKVRQIKNKAARMLKTRQG